MQAARKSLFFALAAALCACGGASSAPSSTSQPTAQAPVPGPNASPESDPAGHGHGHHHGHGHGHDHDGNAYAQREMPHRFTGAEDWAKRFDNPERDAWQKPAVVIERMQITPGMIVADIGAGTGYFEPHLSRAVGPKGKVLALDIEDDMVRYLGERAQREGLANMSARKIGPDAPGLDVASTDRVLIVNTWHHIGERKTYAKKLAASLRPGGAVVVVDFHMHSEKGPPKNHKLPASVVTAELESAGLQVELLLDVLPEQYIVIARRRS